MRINHSNFGTRPTQIITNHKLRNRIPTRPSNLIRNFQPMILQISPPNGKKNANPFTIIGHTRFGNLMLLGIPLFAVYKWPLVARAPCEIQKQLQTRYQFDCLSASKCSCTTFRPPRMNGIHIDAPIALPHLLWVFPHRWGRQCNYHRRTSDRRTSDRRTSDRRTSDWDN